MLQEIGIENKGKELVWIKDNESYQLISLEDIEELLRKGISKFILTNFHKFLIAFTKKIYSFPQKEREKNMKGKII